MAATKTSVYSGTNVVYINAVAMSVLYLVRYAAFDTAEEGLHAVVRVTAQTSLLLLVAVFVASSLRQLSPSPATRWLLVNRRYLGISMGYSHTVHFASLVLLGMVSADFGSTVSPVTLVFGGFGFVMCWLLTLTSSNAMVARLGAARWRKLHKFGVYYLWFIFAQSYIPRMFLTSPVYAFPVALLLGSLALRIWAARTGRAATTVPA